MSVLGTAVDFGWVLHRSAIGIDFVEGQWRLALPTFLRPFAQPSEAEFIATLLRYSNKNRLQQIVFRTEDTISRFLELDDARISELQHHIRRVRRTRNFLVFTFDEAVSFSRSEGSARAVSKESWFALLKRMGRTESVQLAAVIQALSASQIATREKPESPEAVARYGFALEQFLHQSDKVLSLDYEPQRDGVRFERGQTFQQLIDAHDQLAGAHLIVIVQDDAKERPRAAWTEEARLMKPAAGSGWMTGISYGRLRTPFGSRSGPAERILPADIHIAGR